ERDTVKALRRTALWLITIVFGLAIVPTLGVASPLRTMLLAGDSQYRASARSFWISLVLVQCVAWLFLFVAGKGVRRAGREAEKQPAIPEAKSPWHQSGTGSPLEWAVRRERVVKPLFWAGAGLVIFSAFLFQILRAWAGSGQLGAFWLLGSWLPQTILGFL